MRKEADSSCDDGETKSAEAAIQPSAKPESLTTGGTLNGYSGSISSMPPRLRERIANGRLKSIPESFGGLPLPPPDRSEDSDAVCASSGDIANDAELTKPVPCVTIGSTGSGDGQNRPQDRQRSTSDTVTGNRGIRRRLTNVDMTLSFHDYGDDGDSLLPTCKMQPSRMEEGTEVDEPELRLDVVLDGMPRLLTRPAFFGREFVAFGARASAQGTRDGQPNFSVAFAPLVGARGAASEVWFDEAVSDVKWVSNQGVIAASGSSLMFCGPPRDGMHAYLDLAGTLPAPALELAVRTFSSTCRVVSAVQGGFVALSTVSHGRGASNPSILIQENGHVGSVAWDPENEHTFSYVVDTGHVVYIDIRQRPATAIRMPCFQGARTHTHAMYGGVWLVSGEGGRMSFFDRRMGKSLADFQDPLMESTCDAHAHPGVGKVVLFGSPGISTWDIGRVCMGAQGMSHRVCCGKRFASPALPPGSLGPAVHGRGDASSVSPTEATCFGSLLESVQNEVLFGVVTAAPTGVVQIYRA